MPASPPASGARPCARFSANTGPRPASAESRGGGRRGRERWRPYAALSKRCPSGLAEGSRYLVGKPGLDGHSNGAEQIAVRARDAGFEVVYQGIRLTPAQIANAALEEGVHVVGLSILSGSHVALAGEVLERMTALGIGQVPLVVGGIIPPEDAAALKAAGVAAVYTPKDFDLTQILGDIVEIVAAGREEAA